MDEKLLKLILGSHSVRYVLMVVTKMVEKGYLYENGLALNVECITKEI